MTLHLVFFANTPKTDLIYIRDDLTPADLESGMHCNGAFRNSMKIPTKLSNCVNSSADRLVRLLHQLLDGASHARPQVRARHRGAEQGAPPTVDSPLQHRQGKAT